MDGPTSGREQRQKDRIERQVNQQNPRKSSCIPFITKTRQKNRRHTCGYRIVRNQGDLPAKCLLTDHMYTGVTVLSVKTTVHENLEDADGPLGYSLR